TGRPALGVLDPTSLKTASTLASDLPSGAPLNRVMFSPDGTSVIALSGKTIHLWSLDAKKLVRSWKLETPGVFRSVAFDAKGERLAVSSWYPPEELQDARDEAFTPEDVPQPNVFLIDARSAKVERIVAPHGWPGKAAFSPDGRWLALGGAGAVHVFDVGDK